MIPITPLSVYRDHYTPGDPKNKGRDYKYVPIVLGSVYSHDMKRPGHITEAFKNISYAGIGPITSFMGHEIEIKDFCVFLDGIIIARAPANKTPAFKEKFCKAVVWGLKEDPVNITDKLTIPAPVPDPIPAPAPVLIPVLKPDEFKKNLTSKIKKVQKDPAPVNKKEWIPEIIIPDPIPAPAYIPCHPLRFIGPRSFFGWILSDNGIIKNISIPGAV